MPEGGYCKARYSEISKKKNRKTKQKTENQNTLTLVVLLPMSLRKDPETMLKAVRYRGLMAEELLYSNVHSLAKEENFHDMRRFFDVRF